MSAENELNEYIAKLGLSVEMRNALMAKIIGYCKEQRQETASAVDTIVMCDGCNVSSPWEHRCHGKECDCENPVCMERQGKITHEELMKIVNSELKST